MREIKFRGTILFGDDQGRWIAGDLEHFTALDGREMVRIRHEIGHKEIVIPETVGQYTGQKDPNGMEIYEGDVLDFAVFDYQGCDTQYRGVVVFANAEWELWPNPNDEYWGNDGAFNLAWVLSQYDETKVLGNIFDNPELLGGDKK